MRVTVVDPPAYTPPYDHCLCEALAGRGLSVELATSRFDYGEVPEPTAYERTRSFYRYGGGRRWKGLQHPFDMSRLARRTREGVFHFQWLPIPRLDRHLVKRFARPRLLTAHDLLPREASDRSRAATAAMLREMDAVVVHTRSGRQRLVDELAVDKNRVHVIAHGALGHLASNGDVPIDAIAGPLDGRRVVLFFGLIRPYKGLDLLVEAFDGLPDDVVLLVAGMPRMSLEPMLRRVSELGLGERVRLVPRFINDAEIPAYFERAELVVLPYRETEQSGVLFTSLAFGKPTIVSDVGGFSEVARDHDAAHLVPAGDVGALRSAITRLLDDDQERERLAVAATAAASGPYSWARVAEQTEGLYRRLLAERET